jgi:hypothetical protein
MVPPKRGGELNPRHQRGKGVPPKRGGELEQHHRRRRGAPPERGGGLDSHRMRVEELRSKSAIGRILRLF